MAKWRIIWDMYNRKNWPIGCNALVPNDIDIVWLKAPYNALPINELLPNDSFFVKMNEKKNIHWILTIFEVEYKCKHSNWIAFDMIFVDVIFGLRTHFSSNENFR